MTRKTIALVALLVSALIWGLLAWFLFTLAHAVFAALVAFGIVGPL